MIGLIQAPRRLLIPVQGHHGVRLDLPDFPCNALTQIQSVFEHAVRQIQDREVLDSHGRAGLPLFLVPQRADFARILVPDAGFARGQQQVGHVCAALHPSGNGSGTAVFHVVRVGHHAQNGLHLGIVKNCEISHGFSVGSTQAGGQGFSPWRLPCCGVG